MDTKEDKLLKSRRENRARYRESHPEKNISYTQQDYKIILKNAEIMGVTPTEYIRLASLKKRLVPIDPSKKITLELKAEVRKIGHNVNQIAKALNLQYGSHDLNSFRTSLDLVAEQLKSIIKKLD